MAKLVELDLSSFSGADLDKIAALGDKLRLLHRWFRWERVTQDGIDRCHIYSGARGRSPYAAYRLQRHRDGTYELADGRSGEAIQSARTLDAALAALPEDFYYSA